MEKRSKNRYQQQSPAEHDSYAPSIAIPLRCVQRPYTAQTDITLHTHPWAQLVLAVHGVVRVHTPQATYTTPPGRALWITANMAHHASVIEAANVTIAYILPQAHPVYPMLSTLGQPPWLHCRVLEISALLSTLLQTLATTTPDCHDTLRHHSLTYLTLAEILEARPLPLAVQLPNDKRLRHVCAQVIAHPCINTSMAELAAEAGASISTIQRLSQAELGCRFGVWRQQVLLAHAFVLASQGWNMTRIADALGYRSLSAFSYSVRRSLGVAPTRLLTLPD